MSCIISFSFPSADVLITAPFPFEIFSLTNFFNLSCSASFSIFCEIVIISVLGISTIYFPGKLICVDILAPFFSLLSFLICTNNF